GGGGGGGGGGSGGSHSSGPPPNVFYYDCNKQYKNGEEQKQCCKPMSSVYMASISPLSSKTPLYPYCECVSLSCYCSNVASYLHSMQNIPTCPFDFIEFFLTVLAIGIPIGIFYWIYRKFPKYVLHILVIATLFILFEIWWLNSISNTSIQLILIGAFPIAFILVAIASVFRDIQSVASFSSLGEWSSTASAPSGKVMAKAGKVSALLAFWSKIEPIWDEKAMKERATATFTKLQDCWGRREYGEMESLLTQSLYEQHTSQLEAMAARHEFNRMDNLKILDLQIVLARRFEKKEKDEFTAWFKATARDTIVDDRTGKKIRGDSGMGVFEEFWTFSRDGSNWRLREIDQPEEGMHVIGEESFDETATPLMTKTLQERATTGKADTSVSSLREQGEDAGAASIGEIKEKGDKIHRMLNFLSQTDRIWDERAMLENTRTLFILLNTAVEKRNLAKVQDKLSPELLGTIQTNLAEMKKQGVVAQKGNLAVRNVEIVLVNNTDDRQKDGFVAWVSAQAQSVLVNEKTGATVSGDSYVRDFEEYWSFQRSGSEWKLAEINTSMKGAEFVAAENVDEGTSKDMLHWYYSQERAV
ncbi:MAG: Tim44-like domain-containing protein, partial [Candidatus Micrarchaeota archaeon]|nr:Tim44-like domain-containing protein [Candidatus Micrarchaeota archaeon]